MNTRFPAVRSVKSVTSGERKISSPLNLRTPSLFTIAKAVILSFVSAELFAEEMRIVSVQGFKACAGAC